jgi:hypothetical protein
MGRTGYNPTAYTPVERKKNQLKMMQLEEAERQMKNRQGMNALAQESYAPPTPGGPRTETAMDAGGDETAYTVDQPGTPGRMDYSGMEAKAAAKGVSQKEIREYVTSLKKSEWDALEQDVKHLSSGAMWVLNSPPNEVPQRFSEMNKWYDSQGIDVSRFAEVEKRGDPNEIRMVLSMAIDEANMLKMELAKIRKESSVETAKARGPKRGSTAGIVTEKDAWRAYKDEVKRIEGLKAQSWDPDEIDEDAMIEDFIDTVVPEKFRPYVNKTRGTGEKKGSSAAEYEEIKTLKGQKYGRKGDKWYGPLK